jgi:aryl-alcohol dehydrogenase-like predicted oxidoreductase
MNYRSLGRTGAQVSPLCLGCMNFGWGTEEADSLRIIHRALDAGINFLDTANVYGDRKGDSERITGKALGGGRRDRVFLATKVFNKMNEEDPNAWGATRFHIVRECEESLKRLGTDHIDLYQIHRPHPAVPIDETLRALDDLIRAGKVRYIGTSTYAAWQLVESLWAAKELGLNRFVCEQPPYNLLDRRIERELLPMCRTYGFGVIPWAPLAGGLLSGKYRKGQPRPEGARYAEPGSAPMNRDHEGAFDAIEAVIALAEEKGVPPSVYALAWCLNQPGITSPIIGPRTMEQLEDNLKALEVAWGPEDDAKVNEKVPPGSNVSNYYQAEHGATARWM